MAQKVVSLHRSFLKDILKYFPNLYDIFDNNIGPKKHADIIVRSLSYVEDIIADRIEADLISDGVDILPRRDLLFLNNLYTKQLENKEIFNNINPDGKTYLRISSYGAVFCPSYNRAYLEKSLSEYRDALEVDGKYYELAIGEIKNVENQIKRGDFDRTQIYYDALGDSIGDVSQKGYLQISRNIRRKLIEEKAVDGDMISALATDAGDPPDADVFVLLTNDADHFPQAEALVARGTKVMVIGYAEKPAKALWRAVGNQNILNLLTGEREFDFDPIWLNTQDTHSLQILEDIRQQWHWWKSRGLISKE